MKLKFFSTLTDAVADSGISIESHSVTEIISDACGYIAHSHAYGEEIEEMRMEVWDGPRVVWSCDYDPDEYPDDGFNKMIIKLIKSGYAGLFNPTKQQLVARHEEDHEAKTIDRMVKIASSAGYSLDRLNAKLIWHAISEDYGCEWMIDDFFSDEKMIGVMLEQSEIVD